MSTHEQHGLQVDGNDTSRSQRCASGGRERVKEARSALSGSPDPSRSSSSLHNQRLSRGERRVSRSGSRYGLRAWPRGTEV